jgi:hypothetical protein
MERKMKREIAQIHLKKSKMKKKLQNQIKKAKFFRDAEDKISYQKIQKDLKPDVNEIDQLSMIFTNFFKQNTVLMEKIEITKDELFG